MKPGRITTEERERRIKLLFSFILTFKYINWHQFQKFSEDILQAPDHRRLLEFCVRNNYINSYYEPLYKAKFYYLTQKGKDFIQEEKPFAKNYNFEKRLTGAYSYTHHNLIIDTYFLLHKYWNITDWVNEWTLRIGGHRREKFPDGLMLLANGTKIALEAELEYKCTEAWKTVISRYHYDITAQSYAQGVLIITNEKNIYNGIQDRFFKINPEFSNKTFVLTDIEMLKTGGCFYQGKNSCIRQTLKILEGTKYNNG